MKKSKSASSETAAEPSMLLHLLLYAALACTRSTLRREHRALAWRGGRMETHYPMAGNHSHKDAAWPEHHMPVMCHKGRAGMVWICRATLLWLWEAKPGLISKPLKHAPSWAQSHHAEGPDQNPMSTALLSFALLGCSSPNHLWVEPAAAQDKAPERAKGCPW